jgi:hypothetical protein
VPYASTGGLLVDSANLTFNGTTLTAAGLAGPFNGTVGATTANTGAFTTLSASSTVSGTGFSTYLASPPAIGTTAAAAGAFTTLSATGVTTVQAGSAAAPAITTSGDTNTGIFFPAADTIAFAEGGVESARIDASGNLGIGTTGPSEKLQVVGNIQSKGSALSVTDANGTNPFFINRENTVTGNLQFRYSSTSLMELTQSGNLGLGVTPGTWFSTWKGFQIGASGSLTSRTDVFGTILSNNAFINSAGNDAYIGTGSASQYRLIGNEHRWLNAPSGTAGNAISFTQAMTLDAAGDLGVGTTNPDRRLAVASDGTNWISGAFAGNGGTARVVMGNLTDSPTIGGHSAALDAWAPISISGTEVLLKIQNTERARIDSSGNLLVGKTTSADTTVGASMLPSGRIVSSMASSVSGESTLHVYSTGAGAYRFFVNLAGVVNATNTTISAISDQRLKENIQDIDVGLDKIMALKPRKYDWKAGKGKDIKGDRGWIAQEFEQVFPDMVDQWLDPAPEGEEPYKSVRADLIPVLVKAVQEQQALIQTLTARVAALESN